MKNTFKLVLLYILFALPFLSFSQNEQLKLFPLQDVKLLPSPFTKAMDADISYLLALNPDRLLAPYLREAGLPTKAESYGNWENTGLDGHIGGHYLSALAMMYASTGDKNIKAKMDYFLSELKRAQDANKDGYLAGIPGGKEMWKEIAKGNINVSSFSLNKKWVPLYNIHKIYAGLRDAYLFGESEDAKVMLVKLADWMINITKGLSDEQVQKMLISEQGGLNEVFADVFEITGDKKYLDLAKRFSQQSLLQMLVKHEDKLTGMHANTQIPKVIGFEKVAELSGDKSWTSASEFFWDDVVNKRSVSIGGNSVREHFHPVNDFNPMIESEQGPETCNTYNMLKLSKDLYLHHPDEKYIEYYERGLYNHILSSINPEHPGFVYFTPMRPGHYRVYSQPQTSFWCCVGSGLENHSKYGELIYAHIKNDIYVNLFIPSQLNWKEKNINIVQNTLFPDAEKSVITVNPKRKSKFTMRIRYPKWVGINDFEIKVNGTPIIINQEAGSYVSIDRIWKKGDQIELTLPMKTTVEQLPDGENYFSILHGPIVLATKTSTVDMKGLYADDSRGGHVASGPKYSLAQIPEIKSSSENLPSLIQPINGQSLVFQLKNYGADSTAQLMPFFRLHDSRYVLYFKVSDPKKINVDEKLSEKQDSINDLMDKQTIDLVYPGEQQPESDHFVQSEESETGTFKDKHWRDAKQWFSYQLTNPKKQPAFLRVTFYGKDKNRDFTIYINDQKLADVSLDGIKGDVFFTEDYAIPQKLMQSKDGKFTVKFEAKSGSVAGGVFEIRLMKKQD